ncbi:hypothetical protein [uncultured Lacinutrix sp.]|uniref:hypothetical protein n=1 Tax=uncultured Lacinutrix sp. TaxID=574032 RepID=UPI002609CE30|nr:hypothetical protein [uncultured Lacinutrix sp.]
MKTLFLKMAIAPIPTYFVTMIEIKKIVNSEVVIKRIEYFLITLFVVLIAWDLYLAVTKPDNNTISRVIQINVDSGKYILTYFWGAICANVFFPLHRPPKINPTVGTIIMYVIALLIWIANPKETVEEFLDADLYRYGLGMVFGFIIGFVFWRQQVGKTLEVKEE